MSPGCKYDGATPNTLNFWRKLISFEKVVLFALGIKKKLDEIVLNRKINKKIIGIFLVPILINLIANAI
jgi:hypothetical protein